MSHIAKKFKNLYVLIHFYQENRFSLLKLCECLPSDVNEFKSEDYEIENWNPKRTLEVMWDGALYPAHFLQFGDDKKKIDSVIDKLGDKSIKVEDVPVVQCSDVSRQPKNDVEISHQLQNKSSSFAAGQKMKAARKRAANTILAAVNNKISRNSLPENLQELHPKEEKKSCDKCKLVDDCRRILKKKCKSLEEENYMIKEEHMKIRSKYNALKAKYKSLKRKVKSEGIESDFIKIGNSTLVEKHKLNMCRLSCVSKFVSDLLDVVFGREVLANSSMKGIRGASKPPLPENELNDVMSFACEKFSVDVATVRAAVRQKLNVAHKSRATQ